jgi:hypothetical protein
MENFRPRVLTLSVSSFLAFCVYPSNKHGSSALYACAANVMVGKALFIQVYLQSEWFISIVLIFYMKFSTIFIHNPNFLVSCN